MPSIISADPGVQIAAGVHQSQSLLQRSDALAERDRADAADRRPPERSVGGAGQTGATGGASLISPSAELDNADFARLRSADAEANAEKDAEAAADDKDVETRAADDKDVEARAADDDRREARAADERKERQVEQDRGAET